MPKGDGPAIDPGQTQLTPWEVGSISSVHGEKYMRATLRSMWSDYEATIVDWFAYATDFESCLEVARLQVASEDWSYGTHVPSSKLVHAFLLAKLGRVSEAQSELARYCADHKDDTSLAELERALEKAECPQRASPSPAATLCRAAEPLQTSHSAPPSPSGARSPKPAFPLDDWIPSGLRLGLARMDRFKACTRQFNHTDPIAHSALAQPTAAAIAPCSNACSCKGRSERHSRRQDRSIDQPGPQHS